MYHPLCPPFNEAEVSNVKGGSSEAEVLGVKRKGS
jgi:hypothetical protein